MLEHGRPWGGMSRVPKRIVRRLSRVWRRAPEVPVAAPLAPHQALQAVLSRRLILLISTGRSGTEYLTHVLSLFRDVHAEHEPEPSFTNAFRTIVAAPQVARQFWLEQKLPAVARTTAPIYAETSHLACKGFLESGIELGLRPTLVHLVRPYRATARSMLSLNTIPSRTYAGVRFYLGPEDPVLLPVPRDVSGRWHDYQLCYWYCLEIGERARVYAERFAPLGIRVDRVELDDLHSKHGILELATQLALGPLSDTGAHGLEEIVGQRTNQKSDAKRQRVVDERDLDRWEREVEETVGREGVRPRSGVALTA